MARFAGDEFVILAEEDIDPSEARRLGERLIEGFSMPVAVDGEDLYVSASVGISLSSGGATSEQLLRDADAAMYRAKELGRARYEVFDATMSGEAEHRLALQNDLHRALDRHEFVVHYQPIIHLDSGEMVSAEALVRWQHPTRGLLHPADFVPVAEDSGLIVPLGNLVLDQAARQWTAWAQSPTRTINVNLSAQQARHPDPLATVMGVLYHTGLNRTRYAWN